MREEEREIRVALFVLRIVSAFKACRLPGHTHIHTCVYVRRIRLDARTRLGREKERETGSRKGGTMRQLIGHNMPTY